MTRERLFEAANQYAAKQLELHAQYAGWTGPRGLAASVAELQRKLEAARQDGGCLLAIGWGAGFLSKSAAIGGGAMRIIARCLGRCLITSARSNRDCRFRRRGGWCFLKNKPATLPGWVELRVE